MFESDDFDQILCQFDIPGGEPSKKESYKRGINENQVYGNIGQINGIISPADTGQDDHGRIREQEHNFGKENLQSPPLSVLKSVDENKGIHFSPKLAIPSVEGNKGTLFSPKLVIPRSVEGNTRTHISPEHTVLRSVEGSKGSHFLPKLAIPNSFEGNKGTHFSPKLAISRSIEENRGTDLSPEHTVPRSSEDNTRTHISTKHAISGSFEGNKEAHFSPKHTKRKIIDTHFDHKSKRKFPGPAGLLTGSLEENNDESICQLELLSQDLEFSQNNARRDLFESPIWLHLLEDIKSWDLHTLDSIKSIKQQALAGNLRLRKAQIVTAFVETVDRSVTDPLVILRDSTGHIKCTLHRDAWSTFSPYIVSEYCAIMLRRPTVLTTGSAFKKHYLNITLSNIFAIYSSAVLKEEELPLPEGYERVFEKDFTVIKMLGAPQDLGENIRSNTNNGVSEDNNNLLDDLDSIFSDDLF